MYCSLLSLRAIFQQLALLQRGGLVLVLVGAKSMHLTCFFSSSSATEHKFRLGHDGRFFLMMLKRAGCSRTNHHQFIPYMSKDITDHAQVYQLVKKILRNAFDWLHQEKPICLAMAKMYVLTIEWPEITFLAHLLDNVSQIHRSHVMT